MTSVYEEFLRSKQIRHIGSGFDVGLEELNPMLFDWQRDLVSWALKKGRAALFEDCGLGKTAQQLEWARLMAERCNRGALVLTPLAVSRQTVREGEKFGIECRRSGDGRPRGDITVTNYERLHLYDPNDYCAVVCDESSILKNFDGKRRQMVTRFLKKVRYCLLCTATAAPNDYIELGTSAEAVGAMGYMDMLGRFFKNNRNNCSTKRAWARTGGGAPEWVFKKHAEDHFWRWVCSWARALRKPSDAGGADNGFVLPNLIERETVIDCSRPMPGRLFPEPARNLREQRQERRETLIERCEKVAGLVDTGQPAVVWCHLNDEADTLERLIPDARQVSGAMSDEQKEEVLNAFSGGQLRVVVIKPKIGAFGLNWQHCAHMTFFPSHSYEQYYQGVRRCWRFGQSLPVVVDIVTTRGELAVLENLQKKARAADEMFDKLIRFMGRAIQIETTDGHKKEEEVPSWLSSTSTWGKTSPSITATA